MGGRGASFKIEKDKDILDIIPNKQANKQYSIDYGNVNSEIESNLKNKLTNELKSNNIIIYSSFEKLNTEVRDMNLIQIGDLAKKYENIINGYYSNDNLKIRAYSMNKINLKSLKITPEYKTGALFDPLTNQICVNLRNNESIEKLRQKGRLNQENNWSVKTDIRNIEKHIITHEFGHFIENCLIEKRLQKDVKKYANYKKSEHEHDWTTYMNVQQTEARNIMEEIWLIAKDKYHEIDVERIIPSEYAQSDTYEWFAEVFAETNLHTTDKVYVKAMEEFLEKENKI